MKRFISAVTHSYLFFSALRTNSTGADKTYGDKNILRKMSESSLKKQGKSSVYLPVLFCSLQILRISLPKTATSCTFSGVSLQTALTLLQSNYYIFTFVGCRVIENKMLKIKSVIPSAVTCNTLLLFFEINAIGAARIVSSASTYHYQFRRLNKTHYRKQKNEP